MLRAVAVAAALLTATPAFAQATASADVDPALVGDWTLLTVVESGDLGRFGAEIEEMTCAFAADGSARVRLTVEQDDDRTASSRAFQFTTDDGQIEGDEIATMRYEIWGGDLLVLRSADGLEVHLRRMDAGE